MEVDIEIPEELSDLMESCVDKWSGQHRPYGPYERVFEITLKKDYNEKEDKRRIVDFCQSQLNCPKCRYNRSEYLAKIRELDKAFHDSMKVVVEGWYALTPDYQDGKKVTYKWSQDYLD